ncbi:MAG: DNA recombination/repair protein RecA, partial [Oscillospiraceae bacterium]
SQALRKLTGIISKTGTIVIFINQLRQKIGVVYGNPETTTGGMALKFYSSVRLDIRRIEAIKVGSQIVGNRTRVKVVKNKVAPPFKTAVFDIMYGKGISKVGEIVDIGVALDIIQKSGAWFNYGDRRLAQGRENTKALLEQDSELREEIEAKIRERSAEAADAVGKASGAQIVSNSGDDDEDENQDAPREKPSIDVEAE